MIFSSKSISFLSQDPVALLLLQLKMCLHFSDASVSQKQRGRHCEATFFPRVSRGHDDLYHSRSRCKSCIPVALFTPKMPNSTFVLPDVKRDGKSMGKTFSNKYFTLSSKISSPLHRCESVIRMCAELGFSSQM